MSVAGTSYVTTLHFCFFRAASTKAETMSTFPDLGFTYAVFHDFDGAQPGWVLEKRWQYSDDKNYYTRNAYFGNGDDELKEQFMKLVEDPVSPVAEESHDTFFDYARVQ
jgi:hypothetical protein